MPIPAPNFSPVEAFNRRAFLRRAGTLAALSPAAALLFGAEPQAKAYTPPVPKGTALDIAILNFALNLEYLEGEYYTRGVEGFGLAQAGVNVAGGGGTPGTVTSKANPKVPFVTPSLQAFAVEIAADERNHIAFIQNAIIALGGTPIPEPTINLLDSFNTIAQAAGIGDSFDPYANEVNYFLGGYSLTDVGVTAYVGSAALISNPSILQSASGLLAVEAYHAATLRLSIFVAGTDAQAQAAAVANLRNTLDDGAKSNKDQGVVIDGAANIVPANLQTSVGFARNPRKVLNIAYGETGARRGGFFPNGVNGVIQ